MRMLRHNVGTKREQNVEKRCAKIKLLSFKRTILFVNTNILCIVTSNAKFDFYRIKQGKYMIKHNHASFFSILCKCVYIVDINNQFYEL